MNPLLSPTRQTSAFNAHDLPHLAGALAENFVFSAPEEVAGEGQAACIAFYRRWLEDFPDAHLDGHPDHPADELPHRKCTRIDITGRQPVI